MADEQQIENTPVVEEVPAVDGAAPAEGAPAAGEERKRREPREIGPLIPKPDPVEAPNEDAKNKAVQALEAKIAQLDKRVNDIRENIAKQTASRKDMGDQSGTLRAEKKVVRERFDALRAQRAEIFAEMTKQKESRIAAQSKLSEMKKSLKLGTLEEINKRISAIEYEMSTSTISLKDEKAFMNEIKELKASREKVRAVESMTAGVSTIAADSSASQKTLQEQIKDLDQELTALRLREKTLVEGLQEFQAKFEKGGPSIPTLLTEQKALYGQIKEHRNKIRELENEHKNGLYKHRQYMKVFNNWKWQQQQIQYVERQKQYEERRKEREQEEDVSNFVKVPTHPWAEELFIVDDLIKYCKKHVPKVAKEASASAAAKKAFDPATHKAGLIPIGKKSVETDDSAEYEWALPSSAKGGKKGGAAAAKKAPAAAAPSDKPAEDKKLSLSMDAFTGFHTVGVVPPVYASQCAATIQALQAAKVRIQKLTAEDKQKQKADATAQAKAAKETKKNASKPSGKEASGIPTAEVAEPTIDFRKAIRGVAGAHV